MTCLLKLVHLMPCQHLLGIYMFFNCSQNFFKLTQFECISSHFVLEKCLLGLSLAKYKMLQ